MARPREWGADVIVDFKTEAFNFAWHKVEGKRVKLKRARYAWIGVPRGIALPWPKDVDPWHELQYKYKPWQIENLDKAVRALHQDWRNWKFRGGDDGI